MKKTNKAKESDNENVRILKILPICSKCNKSLEVSKSCKLDGDDLYVMVIEPHKCGQDGNHSEEV